MRINELLAHRSTTMKRYLYRQCYVHAYLVLNLSSDFKFVRYKMN